MTSPEHLPDDFAAAIKAADNYADAIAQLQRHELPQPFAAWLTVKFAAADDAAFTLRDAARTFGGHS